MTPYEYSLTVSAYNKRMKQEREDKITAAYMTAYWQRVKTMPSLDEVLGRNQEAKQQTAVDMLEEIKRLNAAFGGTSD